MRKPFLDLTLIFSTLMLPFASCQPPSPGASQPEVHGYIIVNQPCFGIHKVGSNISNQEVDFDLTIDVITLDSNQNAVFFGPAITDHRVSYQNQPSISNKEYDFVCPKETAYWSMVIEVETTGCGFPTPNGTNGKIKYEALSPTLPIPVSFIAQSSAFQVRLITGC